ncbi:MAG: hypothetical protein ACPL1G_05615 [Thermodesulfovibrionales bacterium]
MKEKRKESNKLEKTTNRCKSSLKGFTYTVSKEQLDDYCKWPIERRLKWLYYGNKMRTLLPQKTVEIQEMFRSGKI